MCPGRFIPGSLHSSRIFDFENVPLWYVKCWECYKKKGAMHLNYCGAGNVLSNSRLRGPPPCFWVLFNVGITGYSWVLKICSLFCFWLLPWTWRTYQKTGTLYYGKLNYNQSIFSKFLPRFVFFCYKPGQ